MVRTYTPGRSDPGCYFIAPQADPYDDPHARWTIPPISSAPDPYRLTLDTIKSVLTMVYDDIWRRCVPHRGIPALERTLVMAKDAITNAVEAYDRYVGCFGLVCDDIDRMDPPNSEDTMSMNALTSYSGSRQAALETIDIPRPSRQRFTHTQDHTRAAEQLSSTRQTPHHGSWDGIRDENISTAKSAMTRIKASRLVMGPLREFVDEANHAWLALMNMPISATHAFTYVDPRHCLYSLESGIHTVSDTYERWHRNLLQEVTLVYGDLTSMVMPPPVAIVAGSPYPSPTPPLAYIPPGSDWLHNPTAYVPPAVIRPPRPYHRTDDGSIVRLAPPAAAMIWEITHMQTQALAAPLPPYRDDEEYSAAARMGRRC